MTDALGRATCRHRTYAKTFFLPATHLPANHLYTHRRRDVGDVACGDQRAGRPIDAEGADVGLGQAQVFEELPQRKRQVLVLMPVPLRRDPVDGVVEADVGAPPGEQLHQMIAEEEVGVHREDG